MAMDDLVQGAAAAWQRMRKLRIDILLAPPSRAVLNMSIYIYTYNIQDNLGYVVYIYTQIYVEKMIYI